MSAEPNTQPEVSLAIPAYDAASVRVPAVRSAGDFVVRSRASWLRWGLGLGLGVGLAALALRGLDPARMLSELRSADARTLLVAWALSWVAYRLRALRWGWLLGDGLRRQRHRELFGILMLGYLLNNLLPARAGELARIALMRRHNGVPPAGTLATLVAERAMDGCVLGLAGWYALERALGLHLPWLRSLTIGFAVLLGLLSLVAMQRRRLGAWLGSRDGAPGGGVLARLLRHASEVLQHLGGLAHPGRWAGVLGFTLLVWGVEAVSYACISLSFGVRLDAAQLAGFLAVVNFASLIPTPGGLGAVELAAASVLSQSGIPGETAFVLAGVQHALQYLLCGVFGTWHMVRLGLLARRGPSVTPATDCGSG